jgi:uncharacterized surface protein with fasciclin (FAS1) repeats
MVSVRAMVAFVIAPLFGGLLLQGCGGGAGGGDDSITSLAKKTADLSTLVTALKTAGLDDTLSGKGPFTVFAPGNAAFKALPASELAYLLHDNATLTKVLEYHVASGSVLSSALKNGEKIKTLQGADVNVTITKKNNVTSIMIDDATVTTADVNATNGVIHIIDQVLIPPNLSVPNIPAVAKASGLKTLVSAVTAAKLDSNLSGKGPFTVFAPTDAAFNNLPFLAELLKPENMKDLAEILKYHAVAGEVAAADLKNGQRIKTLEGQDVNVTISGSTISIDKAKVTKADVYAGNGIVHVIDAVMLPPGFTPPTASTCKATILDSQDCNKNHNILSKPKMTQDGCCALCASTKNCKAWTWNKAIKADPDQTCYLHVDCKARTKEEGVVSGTMTEAITPVIV